VSVTDLFRALSGNISRFIYGWLIPSAVSVGLFVVAVLPDARKIHTVDNLLPNVHHNTVVGGLVLSFFTLTLSVLVAYAALPIYRFLEGYTMPLSLKRRLLYRRLREYHRLVRIANSPALSEAERAISYEKLALFPEDPGNIVATKLGNALRGMELYGYSRFGLDSQTLWYELQSLAPERLRQDTEENRAGVDFFISGIAHLTVLGMVALAVAAVSRRGGSGVLGVGALMATWPLYKGAVANVADWRYSVQALINLGRQPLASAMGLRLPDTFEHEKEMWNALTVYVNSGDQDYLRFLNPRRMPSQQS
jgi:hypothetical protein